MNEKIIVDAHGGDNAPLEIIKGCARAVRDYGARVVVVGRENEIRAAAEQSGASLAGIEIRHTEDILTMEDDPVSVVRKHKDSSMAVGLRMLSAGEGGAFVSAGSTGALVVGSRLIVKNLPGIRRAALATVLPSDKGAYMLLDCGANSECKPEFLRDFAVMGSAYMNVICKVESPRVGLLSNGTEEHKGTELTREAKKLIEATDLNFVGYIEGRDAPMGGCDVVVTDGFSGNVFLKLCEGMGKMLSGVLNDAFKRNPVRMLGVGIAYGAIKDVKKQLNYKEYGGAPLLGLLKPVIKAHGTADERVIAVTIKQAMDYIAGDVGGRTEKMINEVMKTAVPAAEPRDSE